MKNYINKIGLPLVVMMGFLACQPEKIEDVNTNLDEHTAYLQHDWELTGIEQVDRNAQPGQLERLDISSAILGSATSKLTFSDGSYVADGAISDLIGNGGSWSLDNPNFPTRVFVDNEGSSMSLVLSQSILEFSNELIFQVDKNNCITDEPSVSYIYTFTKK
jgi:hypothetical protein